MCCWKQLRSNAAEQLRRSVASGCQAVRISSSDVVHTQSDFIMKKVKLSYSQAPCHKGTQVTSEHLWMVSGLLHAPVALPSETERWVCRRARGLDHCTTLAVTLIS